MKSICIISMISIIYCTTSSNSTVEHEKALAYCGRQNVAELEFLNAAKRFWIKASKKNENFKYVLSNLKEKFSEERYDNLYNHWLNLIYNSATGAVLYNLSHTGLNDSFLIGGNAEKVYKALLIISQYIDFSNPLSVKIINALVDDLVLAIGPLQEDKEKLPLLNDEKVSKVIKRASYIHFKLVEEGIDKVNILKVKQKDIVQLKEQIRKIIRSRHTNMVNEINLNTKQCSDNGLYSSLIFRKGNDLKNCTNDWINCKSLSNFEVDHGTVNSLIGELPGLID